MNAPTAACLHSEQSFIRALGGFVLGVAGGELVTHERVPLPQFNFVQVREVAPERRTAFFERALDHYFQRALRPTFRLPNPTPSHLDASLRGLGFRPRSESLTVMRPLHPRAPSGDAYDVRAAREADFDGLLELWTGVKDRPELRSALDVVWHHPNPDEQLTPVLAARGGRAVSGGLLYEHAGVAGLHLIATRTGARGQGAASSLVSGVFAAGGAGASEPGFLLADSDRLRAGLARLGFRSEEEFRVYELPKEAELSLPVAPPPGAPRWRPPRGGSTAEPRAPV